MSTISASLNGSDLRVVMVRAAETAFTRAGRMEGDLDLSLTEAGRSAARRVAEEVLRPLGEVEAVYCASNQSSRETAEVLAGACGGRVRVLPALRGVSLGLWEGQLLADVRQRHARIFSTWYRDPFCITPPGGEEMEDAYRRTRGVVNTILRKHRRGAVAVVAPEAVVGLVLRHLGVCAPERVLAAANGMPAAEVVPVNGKARG